MAHFLDLKIDLKEGFLQGQISDTTKVVFQSTSLGEVEILLMNICEIKIDADLNDVTLRTKNNDLLQGMLKTKELSLDHTSLGKIKISLQNALKITLISKAECSTSQPLIGCLGYGEQYLSEAINEITRLGYDIKPITSLTDLSLKHYSAMIFTRGGQTWGSKSNSLTSEESDLLVEYVMNGGGLLLQGRAKRYPPIIEALGLNMSGKDGGSSGWSWPIQRARVRTFLTDHEILSNINSLHGNASAKIVADNNWTKLAKDQNGNLLLAVRNMGKGRIVLWGPLRSFRTPGPTNNGLESDIDQGDNRQFLINVTRWLVR